MKGRIADCRGEGDSYDVDVTPGHYVVDATGQTNGFNLLFATPENADAEPCAFFAHDGGCTDVVPVQGFGARRLLIATVHTAGTAVVSIASGTFCETPLVVFCPRPSIKYTLVVRTVDKRADGGMP